MQSEKCRLSNHSAESEIWLSFRCRSSRYRHRQGFRTPTTANMSKVNRGSHGCRAMVIARKYLSGPSSPVLTRSSSQRQRKMLSRQHRMASCNAAGTEGNPAALAQQEHLGYFSTGGRRAKTNLNLIYRDVKAFLGEVGGDPREARYWLTQFQKATSGHSPAFAVLEVDRSAFDSREMVQSLAFGLSFLQRMDMKPVVVMGWSDHLETGLAKAEFGSECMKGLVNRCQQLTEALQQHTASVLPFFSAESLLLLHEAPAPPSITMDTNLLQWSLNCGAIPLVCPVGRDAQGCSVMLDPTEVTAAISRTLHPHKVMFLNNFGGLQSQEQKVLGTVSLPADLPGLSTATWLSAPERQRVTAIARLLNQLPAESSAVITSADTLLTELFSHRGSGTLFKNGDPIHRYNSLDGIDVDCLLALINKSFEKTLKKCYIDSLKGRLHSIYLSEGYSAAAIVTMEPVNGGTPYLDKFVVSSSKQGQGTSHILWECIRQDLGKLFWRSRNPLFKKKYGHNLNHSRGMKLRFST
uniref:N-acetylglutamate synthase n=1 Tax=Neolamprologus brichardi TaxID=32507 RepID=A0A3Q4MUJ5_NEOBR